MYPDVYSSIFVLNISAWLTEKEQKIERQRVKGEIICWFTPQIATITVSGPGQGKESEILPGWLMTLAEEQAFGHIEWSSKVHH